MLFSSITFLYYFLPIVFLIYYMAPRSLKNLVLLLSSLFFYAWGEPKYCLLMLVSILCGYVGGLCISSVQKRKSEKMVKYITWLWVLILLSFLAIFKYTDFVIGTVNQMLHTDMSLLRLALPIGISFYTFQIVSYLIDVYRRDVEVERNIINFGAYVVMFPQLIAGPIVRFSDVQRELRERTISVDKTAEGIGHFVIGLSKKVLLADLLGEFVTAMEPVGQISAWMLWLVALAYAMQIYFDFSGYSDMAIGLGYMLGFHFPKNFDYPYVSKSITEFWRRWHMTLGGWFRDYVYIPLGGNRGSVFKWIRNVFVVWFLSGLWHGASWNFVLWGLYFGILLALEKLFLKAWLEKLPGILQHLYAIVLVVISFVIFRLESLREVGSFLAGMFGFGLEKATSGAMAEGLYQVQNYGFILALAVVIALRIPQQLWEKLAKQEGCQKIMGFVRPVLYLAMLLIVTAFLIQSSAHPFLYFRF